MAERYGGGGGGGGGGSNNPADILAGVMSVLQKRARGFGPIVVALLLVVVALTGFYQVEPGEIAVLRTLGRETSRSEPGLHFRIPLVQTVDTVNTSEVRRIEVGFRGDENRPAEAQMITGDGNMVEAHMTVQYRVADPSKFLFRLSGPEEVLRSAAEVALRSVIGRTTIDDAITRGRGDVQQDTLETLQRLMDAYQSGISVSEVKLQSVDPPAEVKDAFHDVVRAREEKEKLINQARGYQEDVIPRARGEAERTIREAEGYKEQRMLMAKGDAHKFSSIYAEYQKAQKVTRRRMYLETMERVLRKVEQKTIVDGALAGSTVPILALGGPGGAARAMAATNGATP